MMMHTYNTALASGLSAGRRLHKKIESLHFEQNRKTPGPRPTWYRQFGFASAPKLHFASGGQKCRKLTSSSNDSSKNISRL